MPEGFTISSEEANTARLALNWLTSSIHEQNVWAGWYTDLWSGERKERNIGEMLCLIHSEISEGFEGYRKGNQRDDKLVHRSMLEVELADALIRIFDLAGYLKLDLGGALTEKRLFNLSRADHSLEERRREGGKKC